MAYNTFNYNAHQSVIARGAATRRSTGVWCARKIDCFAARAM